MIQSEKYHELLYYTLSHPNRLFFIHQYIVDAHTAQMAHARTKPISIVYALIGLYLAVEQKYTGKQVQQAHIKLSKSKKGLPKINLPKKRGEITITDVLRVPPGSKRDKMIKQWCASVWKAFGNNSEAIVEYCNRNVM